MLEPAGTSSPDFSLPAPEGLDTPLGTALANRRSCRSFSGQPVSTGELSLLCWAAMGVTRAASGQSRPLRAAPSAGALYALDLYAALPGPDPRPGIHRYVPERHILRPVLAGPAIERLTVAALNQEFVRRSSVVFVMTANPDRSVWKYEDRSWRYFYLDAGHAGMNIMLAAEALGLGSCGIGAFFDTAISSLMLLETAREIPIYMVAVGRPRGG